MSQSSFLWSNLSDIFTSVKQCRTVIFVWQKRKFERISLKESAWKIKHFPATGWRCLRAIGQSEQTVGGGRREETSLRFVPTQTGMQSQVHGKVNSFVRSGAFASIVESIERNRYLIFEDVFIFHVLRSSCWSPCTTTVLCEVCFLPMNSVFFFRTSW